MSSVKHLFFRALLIFIFVVPNANVFGMSASGMDGNMLLDVCKIELQARDKYKSDIAKYSLKEKMSAFLCLGYLSGVRDSHLAISVFNSVKKNPKSEYDEKFVNKVKENYMYCLPDDIGHVQILKIVVKYYENNPSLLKVRPAAGVIRALNDNFPCDKQ